MEDSKLQKLHETLKALAPKGKVGGLGFYAKAGHRSRRSAADGMPEDKRALYSFFVRAGDGPSGHTHFADDGDKKLKKKKKKKKTKAPPPPSSDESSSSSSEDEAPPPPKKTKKRKEAAARLADIDAAAVAFEVFGEISSVEPHCCVMRAGRGRVQVANVVCDGRV